MPCIVAYAFRSATICPARNRSWCSDHAIFATSPSSPGVVFLTACKGHASYAADWNCHRTSPSWTGHTEFINKEFISFRLPIKSHIPETWNGATLWYHILGRYYNTWLNHMQKLCILTVAAKSMRDDPDGEYPSELQQFVLEMVRVLV